MKPLYFISAILLSACAEQDITLLENTDAPVTDNAMEESHVVTTPENISTVEQPLSSVCSDHRILYVNPDNNIIPYVITAIDRFALLGFNVAIQAGGTRMYEVTSIPSGQAYSYWSGSRPCEYDGCNSTNSHIKVTTALLQRTDTAFINNSIAHEIGHLISGFGSCVTPALGLTMQDSMHLLSGHLVSNGNTGYANMTVTEQDSILLRSCL